VTGKDIRLKGYGRAVTRGTPMFRLPHPTLCNMHMLLNMERNEAAHGRDTSARPNPPN